MHMWQPIANEATQGECWSTIADIDRALTAHLAQQQDAPDPYPDTRLSAGIPGVALFFAYLDRRRRKRPRRRSGDGVARPDHRRSGRRPSLPALYSGFCGAGWVITHLTRTLYEGDGDLAGELDDALRHLLSDLKEKPPFELLGGLAGYGTYLVERLPAPSAMELLRRVIDLLDSSREAAGVWYTNPDWLPAWQRELMPRGCYNLGVAHGVPGVIGFLAAAWREGFRDPRIPPLADDAVRWLLRKRDRGRRARSLAHVPPDDAPRQTRTAWCYGDLGIAAVLLSAAMSFDPRRDWYDEALLVARAAARRSFLETKVIDVGLCHGAIGLAPFFNRIHQATGDGMLCDAAAAWYQHALAMRRPGEGMAGLLSWVDKASATQGEWESEPGFLSGIAGVGLALLAAVTDLEPLWDRVLLVAVPPRNGAEAA